MRIAAVSDVHVPSTLSINEIGKLNDAIKASSPDVLVIAGSDIFGEIFWAPFFDSFSTLSAKKLIVPGNHELWTVDDNESSMDLYNKFQDTAESYGFHCLDRSPVGIDGVGFAGNIGWYDYSFRSKKKEELLVIAENPIGDVPELSMEHYRNKRFIVYDGRMFREYFWPDIEFLIPKPFDDVEFAELCIGRLERDLSQLKRQGIENLVAVTHTIPFETQLPRTDRSYGLFRAYMGCSGLGRVMKEQGVRVSINGHTHHPGVFQITDTLISYNVSYRASTPTPTIIEI